jgi:hypothetical protein
MYHVVVVVPRSIHGDIRCQPHVCDTRPQYWTCMQYSSLLAAIGTCRLACSGVYHSVEVLSFRTCCRDSLCLVSQYTFPATSTAPVPFRIIFLFHSARSVHVQLTLCWFPAVFLLTALPAVQLSSAFGRALHQEQCIY